MAATCLEAGLGHSSVHGGRPNPFVFVRAARSRHIHGGKSRRRKSSRTIGMYAAAHNPLSWRVLSVAGRWLGCVLEQSTALRLRWCEAVVMMGMPRDVLRQMISRSLPVICFQHIWCYFLRSSAANGKHTFAMG